jgi:hypothetical protein
LARRTGSVLIGTPSIEDAPTRLWQRPKIIASAARTLSTTGYVLVDDYEIGSVAICRLEDGDLVWKGTHAR